MKTNDYQGVWKGKYSMALLTEVCHCGGSLLLYFTQFDRQSTSCCLLIKL